MEQAEEQRREGREGEDHFQVRLEAHEVGAQHQRDLEHIDQQHRLAVCKAERQQAVVQVVVVGREGRAPGAQACQHHRERVDDRQPEQQQRQGRAEGRVVALRGEQRQCPDAEAEHLAAAVAHEDTGRVCVESQEAEHGAGLDEGDGGDRRAARHGREQRDRAQAEQHQPPGETIESVGEVDGVGDADQEHEGDQCRDRGGERLESADSERADVDSADDHGEADGEHLAREFEAVPQREAVVPQAEEQEHRESEQQTAHRRGQRHGEQQRREEPRGHGEPADPRHRCRVNLAGSRPIGESNGGGPPGEKRDQCSRDRQRDDEREKKLHGGRTPWYWERTVALRQLGERTRQL